MAFTYQTRRRFRRFFTTILWLLLILCVVWTLWMVWLHRFIVYSQDGVHLDFSHSSVILEGEVAQPPAEQETISIYYNEGINKIETGSKLPQLLGYSADTEALLHDPDAVREQIEALPPGSAVMLDVKSIYGNFFYSTQLKDGSTSDSIDIGAMDRLIAYLKSNNLYAIARVPAFRDRSFGLSSHESGNSCGLPEAAGNLWEDSDGCYWLDPAAAGTKNYLVSIINELRVLGFDEVVFSDFFFPDSGGAVVYESDRTQDEIIRDTAAELVSVCATNSFAVSFQGGLDFPLPIGRSRLYIENIPADKAAATAAAAPVEDPQLNLVFLADSNDTRYNDYSTLRRLNVGQ